MNHSNDNITFDYYYGKESEQFKFFRIPKELITNPKFSKLSSDAKLLYGLMLDKMSLSQKNNWFDKHNRVYIIYTIDEIMEELNRSNGTCTKILAELDTVKGIGLIERKKQGLGKPDLIYVKNFISIQKEDYIGENTPSQEMQHSNISTCKNRTTVPSNSTSKEMENLHSQTCNNSISRNVITSPADMQNVNGNNTNTNYTDMTENNSIHLSSRMDENEYITALIELIKKNIEYDHHMRYESVHFQELYEELFQIMCDAVCIKRDYVKIGKDNVPYELVKNKFLKLNSMHLRYVIDCLDNTTSNIFDINSYLLKTLYNAPSTINFYYKQKVQHDMAE